MDGKDGLILWTLGGTGIFLLYSAYANKSPKVVLAATLGTPSPAINPVLHERQGRPAGEAPGTTGTDSSGTAYLFDADGNMAGVIPQPYQGSAATWIPPKGVFNA